MIDDGTWLKLNFDSQNESGSGSLGTFYGIRNVNGEDAILTPLSSTQTM